MSNTPYTIQDGKIWVDPKFCSFIRIGMKTSENNEHWTTEFILDSQKKTIICFGGDGTRNARAANGNINSFVKTLDFTKEQQNKMQMLANYEDIPEDFFFTLHMATNIDELYNNDFVRETLKVFMPFIAKKTKSGWDKISDKNLLNNMHNILIVTHCYGTSVMIEVLNILKQEMRTLGYNQQLIDTALKQILCISNNSQLEMTEDIPTTILQRYSVADGQSDRTYDKKYSNSYPVHLDENSEFSKIKGKKSAFIKLNENEIMMAFDKILMSTDIRGSSKEHNEAFFETDLKKLTKVGREQMKLMRLVVQYWYNNHDEIPDAMDLLKKVAKGTDLELFVATSILNGEMLKKEHNNPLRNSHSLEVSVNRFKNQDIEPEHTGIWKLLEKNNGHN
ncbi:MAG: hypothetical protein J6Y07_04370 [Alphaproteobacteria bacterium]|nr:hypothetical protein [Alphaproteobacteria bacterium]